MKPVAKKIRVLSDLIPDDRNANRDTERGRGVIEQSLRKYGTGRSILIDKNGRIIADNKTIENAGAARLKDVLVVQSDGTKLIVVQRTDLDLKHDKAAKELAIADNRAAELNLSWDPEVLAELGAEIDLTRSSLRMSWVKLPQAAAARSHPVGRQYTSRIVASAAKFPGERFERWVDRIVGGHLSSACLEAGFASVISG